MPKTKGPNKSAFIRSMPTAHPNEIVKAADAQGIKLTPSFVYAIRAMDKQKTKGGKAKARVGKSNSKGKPDKVTAALAKKVGARDKTAADSSKDLRHQFVAIAMRIGTDEAQRLLDRIVDVQTPLSALKR